MIELNIQRFGGRGASSSQTSGWNGIVNYYKGEESYNRVTDGIEQVQLINPSNELTNEAYQTGKNYSNTTREELDNAPIQLVTYADGYKFINIYKNRKDLFNSVNKEYGGFNQIGGRYTIMNSGNVGEFYLVRDRYSKGGWDWQDANGMSLRDKQWKTIRRRNI